MRIEIILLLIVSAVCYHIYTDGKWIDKYMSYKKYYQMAAVIFVAFVFYWMIKKDPARAHSLIVSGNEYLKYLPVDSSAITPIIDFTKQWTKPSADTPRQQAGITRMNTSGGGGAGGAGEGTIKRSVSESKKKYVASQQDWCCYTCKQKLKATFEVDHILPLFKGGTNHIDNLRALCVECHRECTIQNKLSI